jgi:hypothetical protein
MDTHTKDEVMEWLETHPQTIHGDPLDIMQRCERSVRHHAAAIAWRDARDFVRSRRRLWEQRWGFEVESDDFVAREICGLLAHELRGQQPSLPDGAEDDLADADVLADLDRVAWVHMRPWVRELAIDEERATWKHVVRFTRKRGRALVREGRMPAANEPSERSYSGRATSVADILMTDYDAMAISAMGPDPS